MDAGVDVATVETRSTRCGAVRYVVRAADGREFTTFREEIGREAEQLCAKPAQISFHEEQRGGFANVYLDAISPAPAAGNESTPAEKETGAVAWNAAIEAAPWLVGSAEPKAPVRADELFERLRRFDELVAEDIREHEDPT